MGKFVFRDHFENKAAWDTRNQPVDARSWPKEEADLMLAQKRLSHAATVDLDGLQQDWHRRPTVTSLLRRP